MKKFISVFLLIILICSSIPFTAFSDDTVMVDGVIYSSDMTCLINCTEKYSGSAQFSVPQGVKEISTGAFLDNSTITTVYLPSSLERISADAFRNSSIESVYLNESAELSHINNSAFFDCKKLKSVSLCNSTDTNIGENVFKNCIALTDVCLPDCLVPETAFIGCTSLKYVSLGKNKTACKSYGIGFMDSDGNVTANNARSILRLAAELDVKLANVHLSADVNRDGKITAADARTTLRVSAKLEEF